MGSVLIVLACLVLLALHFWRWRVWQAALRDQARLQQALAKCEERSEEADFQGRARLQTLFNSMVEGVMLLDQSGHIQLVNQSLERQFDLRLDVRGLTVVEALRRPELAALVEQLGRTGQVVSLELDLNGSRPRCLEANAAAILDRDGHPQGAILVFHDLTRIRLLENTRREFVGNVSHELRTPLSFIKGYAETLLSGAKDDPEHSVRFLQKIERHANRLNNLIEDLLTISKLESGRVVLKLDHVEVRTFANRLIEDLQSRAAEKRMVIENQIPEGLQARADLDRLQQVFYNLLDNAIKYGKTGGRILLEGRERPDQQVQLCVSDDGPGIPAEAKARVFERFFRVDKARSRETGGTGLGLAIVKHIVQSHGGEVWVESEPGRGTSFFFTLPGMQPESPAAWQAVEKGPRS
jgi:two-component system, OmpR family, phosphate regulon sensor histidine kinase PhoR